MSKVYVIALVDIHPNDFLGMYNGYNWRDWGKVLPVPTLVNGKRNPAIVGRLDLKKHPYGAKSGEIVRIDLSD